MPNTESVIISCAGLGSRLGMNMPKCLVDIHGKPLIIRHLEMLDDVDNIIITVGYEASQVIQTVLEYRRDVLFAFNHEFLNTGNSTSLSCAAKYASGKVLSLDGDLVVDPDDFKQLLTIDSDFICYSTPRTTDCVHCTVSSDGQASAFSKTPTDFEWTGLFQLDANKIHDKHYYIFEMLESYLPIPAIKINAMDIDSPDDYESALSLSKTFYKGLEYEYA